MSKIIEYHQLTDHDEFCCSLKKLNVKQLLMDLSSFGNPIFISSHSHKTRFDTIVVDISKMTKGKIIKMFVFMCKFKPTDVEDLGDMISFYWH